jgi:hypothetical protein
MLPPEIIDKLRKDQQKDDRPSLELPLPAPCGPRREAPYEEDEEKTAGGVIVIDLA